MNARERQSYGEALIAALVRTRDDFEQTDNVELFECLMRELPRMIDVNNFDQRTRRARSFVAIVNSFCDLKQKIHDYLLEFK